MMDRSHGLLGVVLILGIAWACSNNRRQINLRLVLSGLGLQVLLAILIFRLPVVANTFKAIENGIGKIEEFAREGLSCVIGGVAVVARALNFIMRVSGAEALSNVASALVGQVEAQAMGVPSVDIHRATTLLRQKLTVNEFVAFRV